MNRFDPTTVGGSISRSVDVHPFMVRALIQDLGLGYPKAPFSPDMNAMYAIEFPAQDLQPGRADFMAETILDNFDELEGLKSEATAYDRRVEDLVAERFDSDTAPDLLKGGKEVQEVAEMRKELIEHARYSLDDSTRKNDRGMGEPVNPFRGNGFAGQGGGYSPEMLILGREPIPGGAEFWRLGADGQRELVARFVEGRQRWELAR